MDYLYGMPRKKKSKAKTIAIVNVTLIFAVAAFFLAYTYTIERAKSNQQAETVNKTVSENIKKTENIPEAKEGVNTIKPDSPMDVTYNYSCGHSVEKIETASPDLAGLTKEQIEAVHSNCIVESINPDMSVMNVYLEEICDDHYVIKLEGDYIKVYNKNSMDKEERKMKTDRTMLYPEDIKILEDGIEVSSRESLLQYLEDFSS